ncbi:hypothetical protein FPV67DRAFT_1666087 [Lyophyllum atratum]|nr:hypothetical protein FPV67DRAFT_1666087 [Lyophyllum atratum]
MPSKTRIPSSAAPTAPPTLLRPLPTLRYTRPGPPIPLRVPRIGFVNPSYLDNGSGHALHEAARRKDLQLIELAASTARTRFRVMSHNTTFVDPTVPQAYRNKYTNVAHWYNTVYPVGYRNQEDETIASRGSVSLDRLCFEVNTAPVPAHHSAAPEVVYEGAPPVKAARSRGGALNGVAGRGGQEQWREYGGEREGRWGGTWGEEDKARGNAGGESDAAQDADAGYSHLGPLHVIRDPTPLPISGYDDNDTDTRMSSSTPSGPGCSPIPNLVVPDALASPDTPSPLIDMAPYGVG